MGVSVVVPTVDRVVLLERCLAALELQEEPADEVLVVHDGAPQVVALLSAWDTRLPLTALRISERGASAKRNAGWRAATQDLVAFTDDDCAPEPGWLAALRRETADLVAGPVVAHPDDVDVSSVFGRTIEVLTEGPLFPAANVAVRRVRLVEVGGFDTALGGGEDTDLAWRVKATGATVAWAPEAVVRHAVRPVRFPAHLRSQWRWRSLPLVVRRHPELRQALYARVFWKPSHPLALLALAGLLGTPLRKPAALLTLPLFVKRWQERGPRFGTQLAVADLTEVAVVAVGSVRHRSLLL
jgi:GT2 family glycosyltransferase